MEKRQAYNYEVSPNMIKKANSQYRESEESRETLLVEDKKSIFRNRNRR